jgi:hypothetical protein
MLEIAVLLTLQAMPKWFLVEKSFDLALKN